MERVLRRPAAESGWELCFATDGEAALAEMGRSPVEVMLVDDLDTALRQGSGVRGQGSAESGRPCPLSFVTRDGDFVAASGAIQRRPNRLSTSSPM